MSILRGNQRHKSNFIVTTFILFITACYVGLLYTQIKQEFDAAEAYAVHPWGAAFSPTGAPAPSVAPQGTLPSSSSPQPTYRFRSTGGISNMPSGGGVRSIRVPVPSRGAGFRVYNNAGASGTSYAFRPASGSAGGSASGITLTSDAVLRSYGGGTAAGSSMQGASSQNRSSQATSTGGGSLSAPVLTVSMPVYTLAYTPTTIGTDADKQAAAAAMASAQWQQHTGFSGSGAIFSSPISSPYRTVNGVSSFLSADEYLAYSQSGNSNRNRAPGNIGSTFSRWLAEIVADSNNYLYEIDGVYYFSESTLRALFEAAQSSGNFPGLTWEKFLSWFTSGQGSNATYQFPVGEPWVLLILAVLYAVFLLWRRSPRYIQRP